MAVLGPLGMAAEPQSYDLCETHAERTTAPEGWQLVRYTTLGGDTVAAFGTPARDTGYRA